MFFVIVFVFVLVSLVVIMFVFMLVLLFVIMFVFTHCVYPLRLYHQQS